LHELAVELELDEDQMIPFSAVTGEGRDELAEALVSLLAQPDWRTAGGVRESRSWRPRRYGPLWQRRRPARRSHRAPRPAPRTLPPRTRAGARNATGS